MKHNKKPSALRVSKAGTAASWMLLLVYLSPLYLVFSIALKSKEDFAKNGFAWPKTLVWENLSQAAEKMNVASTTLNSAIVTFVSIVLILLFASWASYAIGRRGTKGYRRVYLFFTLGMMIPF